MRSIEERDLVSSEQRSETGGHLKKKTGYRASKNKNKNTQPLGEMRNAHYCFSISGLLHMNEKFSRLSKEQSRGCGPDSSQKVLDPTSLIKDVTAIIVIPSAFVLLKKCPKPMVSF